MKIFYDSIKRSPVIKPAINKGKFRQPIRLRLIKSWQI